MFSEAVHIHCSNRLTKGAFLRRNREVDPRMQAELAGMLDSTPYSCRGGVKKVSSDVCIITATEVRGHLLDLNSSGFRAKHQHQGLRTGQRVKFNHAYAQGVAQVIWNRILPDCVETGFLILDAEDL